ncbi:uncharacterized protein LOC131322632 [Rhododendron vialii]|uniref:uncharacterized protein LOC131322632 n=1 Tax=Rhododendron vialii TaxID=182163 RepID=UPI00265F96CC|nr:uncharacterized protein LOC131322632 [Rhododendron vialii]
MTNFAHPVFLLIFSFLLFANALTDTILQGQSLTTSTSITSSGNKFELGFFTPGQENSTKNSYLGVWYKRVLKKTVVWVANRDNPFTDSTAVLTIAADGNLVIGVGRVSYMLSNISSSGNTSATLLESGNLVLNDRRSGDILWQSFDYPTDTLLPGMKVGCDKRNGKTWSLLAWKSKEDPGPGVFSFELDPQGTSQFFILKEFQTAKQKKGFQKYWTTGTWNGQVFTLVPEMAMNYFYSSIYVSNENESYYTCSMKNPLVTFRLVMDMSGQLQVLTTRDEGEWDMLWAQPWAQCDVYAYCGAFGTCNQRATLFCQCFPGFQPNSVGSWKAGNMSGGCVRKAPLQCGNDIVANGQKDQFQRISKVTLPDNSIVLSQVRSAGDCQSACFSNCSCSAYAYDSSNGCSIWREELLNVKQLKDDDANGRDFFLKLAASEFLSEAKDSRIKRWKWIIVALALSMALLAAVSFFYCLWRRKSQNKGEDLVLFDLGTGIGAANCKLNEAGKSHTGKKKEDDLPLFSFTSVSAATDNFSDANKLGQGGFGPVYKGKLQKGHEVAVKRLSRKSGQGLEELQNEAMLTAKLQHQNLVRILGCCIEKDEKILIYEYMPNKSLDFFLFDPIKYGILNWEVRVNIIEGIAQGLLYLHLYSRLRIIHRDLKASNILLDRDMNPKISDFGMARIFGGNRSQATDRIVGTYGYMSPEYASDGLFSIKSDVFSFGVLLLEILSGKKNTGFYNRDSLNLLGYAWDLWKSGRGEGIKDPVLQDISSTNMLLRYVNIALLCVQESAADRPTMTDIVSMLSNELVLLASPKQPAFSASRSVPDQNSSKRLEIYSINDVTVSILESYFEGEEWSIIVGPLTALIRLKTNKGLQLKGRLKTNKGPQMNEIGVTGGSPEATVYVPGSLYLEAPQSIDKSIPEFNVQNSLWELSARIHDPATQTHRTPNLGIEDLEGPTLLPFIELHHRQSTHQLSQKFSVTTFRRMCDHSHVGSCWIPSASHHPSSSLFSSCQVYDFPQYTIWVLFLESESQILVANTNNSRMTMKNLAHPIFFLIFSFPLLANALTDTILQGEMVTASTTITSSRNEFELGFFSPGNENSRRSSYLGIWYKRVSKRTVVWVANRDYPLADSSAVLTIAADGNLVIREGSFSDMLSNISSSGNTSATLLDTGNLVLIDRRSGDILWQSFDYPTDTLLPGMKVGYDKRNGKTWSMLAWKSKEDPAPGVFSFELDPEGTSQFFILKEFQKSEQRKGFQKYWTSGTWNGQIFTQIPEMAVNYIGYATYISNDNESYFNYSLKIPSATIRLMLDISGQLQVLSWDETIGEWNKIWAQPRELGDVNERKDQFLRISNVSLPANSIVLSQARSVGDCESACFSNCSCSAYTYDGSHGCSIWGIELLNVQLIHDDPEGRDFYLRLAASEFLSECKDSRTKRWKWIILALAVPMALLATISFFYCLWRRKSQNKGEDSGEDLMLFDIGTSTGAADCKCRSRTGKKKEVDLPLFSFASVSAATDDFSDANKLGEGGFGPVYKGKLVTGYEVAVKRLSRKSGQGLEELQNEAMLIAKLQHNNLVRLLGCCIEKDEKILIYENMPNKSLDFFLFDPIKHGILSWELRVKIVEGIAQGLLYLHQYSRLRIIHRDLKASNILLDEDMNPKISDFGMARIFEGNGSHATNRIVGTYGYMSPEYASEGLFSIKSDVFSFGVLLLEILSGKRSTGFYNSDSLNVLGYAWDLWKSGKGEGIKDPILPEIPSANMLLRYVNIALLCVQESAADRPTMLNVVSMLNNEQVLLPSPKQPAFSATRSAPYRYSTNQLQICSMNDVTISILEAR